MTPCTSIEINAEEPIAAGTAQIIARDERTLRTTECGALVGGITARGAFAWLGIPYAQPPVGALRWRAPRVLPRWSGVYAALQIGNCSSQRVLSYGAARSGDIRYAGGEDCLYLNIWGPVAPTSERLPVIVWLHGGGNVRCEGGTFDASVLTTTQQVVVVTLNHRLGVFGWFRHRALRNTATAPDEQSGNFGTLDMVCALRWVRDHIGAFGGAADNVTIAGESSGGSNVFALLVSPLARGLFHRAIVQSGSPATTDPITAEHFIDDEKPGAPQSTNELLLHLLRNDGLASDRASAKAHLSTLDDTAIATYLRAKTFVDFDRAYVSLYQGSRQLSATQGFPQPFRDGAVIPHCGITQALGDPALSASVPVLIGSTRDEYASSALAVLFDDRNYYDLAVEYLTDLFQAFAVDAPAAMLLHRNTPVYVYRFDWDGLLPPPWMPNLTLGATHGIDVPFVFGHLQLGSEFYQLPLFAPERNDSFIALSQIVMSYWTTFARDGNPGRGTAGELLAWPQWRGEAIDGATLVLDYGPKTKPHLISNTLSKATVLKRLQHDQRFGGARERCEFLRQLLVIAGGFGLLDAADYANFVSGVNVTER
jgi:para-nitrobenzyl esterase